MNLYFKVINIDRIRTAYVGGDIVKVDIKKVNSYDDEHAELSVVKVTDTIQSAIDTLENNCRVN